MALLLAFFAIYVIWGSTYLAIRYAVESIPPLLVVAVRQGLAGLVLFAWAVTRRGFRPTAREWRASFLLGTLYFVFGHGTLHWAETFVPSGLAALVMATEPLIIALLAAALSHQERLTAKTLAGAVLGLAGVGLLVRDEIVTGHPGLIVGTVALLFSSAAWSVGVIYSSNKNLPSDSIARAGMSAFCGAVILLFAALFTGEIARAHPSQFTARSIWGLLYLIVFGSIVAFTAYTWLLDHVSPTLVSTHTYANPIIAVLLGWALAGESMDWRVLLAGTLTLFSVFLINRGTRPKVVKLESEAEAA